MPRTRPESRCASTTAFAAPVPGAQLRHIVAQARERGIRSLWLETGSEDAFISARALDASEGFAPCRPFEGYAPDPLSTFMTREL